MAKTLIIYPYADGVIGHTKSNNTGSAASLINEQTNSANGYLQQTFNFVDAAETVTSSFSGFSVSDGTSLNKFRLNSILSVNLYFAKYRTAYTQTNITINDLNIFGTVTLNGTNYISESYTDGTATNNRTTIAHSLSISTNSINRTYQSVNDLNVTLLLSTAGRAADSNADGTKNRAADLRIYNANVTISYDDVFDCAVQVITGNGISTATVSSSEVVEGDTCTFSATVQNDYVFDGWYDNEDFDGDSYSTDSTFTMRIVENTTLYPKAVKEGYVPPEEDPTKVFYPIVISSINARTSPSKGTTKIESGTSRTVKITPTDPIMTLALDNGVDISSQLVGHGNAIQAPTVANVQGASYGFNLNSNTGYYTSTNNGVADSAAICRVTFNSPVRCLVTIQYINYAEVGNDFGMFGNIDSALSTGNTVDANVKLACSAAAYNVSTPQTLTYEFESGSHYIDIKYRKNDTVNSNNDNLQFKVLSIEPLEVYDFYYTYDIQNISGEHVLNFVFGNVEYYFVTSQTNSNAQLYPYGQTIVLPGDEYKLTIVPENQNETVTLYDNGTDVSSQLQVVNVEKEEDGQTVTIKNYIYRLNNVQAAHNLSVETTKPITPLFVKINGSWVSASYYVKHNGVWTRLSITDIYSHNGVKWLRGVNNEIKTNNIIFFGNINN